MNTAECKHCGTRRPVVSTFQWENGKRVAVVLCRPCADSEASLIRHLNILESLGGRVYV